MTRNVWKEIWEGFVKSLTVTPERTFGEFRGKDHLGNKYYEIGPDPRGGRSRASRWFESPNQDLMQDLPVEWMAWLRRQRTDPPTQEEIQRNLGVTETKRRNAATWDARQHLTNDRLKAQPSTNSEPLKPQPSENSNSRWPKYSEFERFPGEKE